LCPTILLGHGDPSAFPSFHTTSIAEDAVVDALHCAKFNGYALNVDILPPIRAIAEHLSEDLPYKLSHFDPLPEKGCEVDLDAIEALADENIVAMLIVNPGNHCGNVFTYRHLKKFMIILLLGLIYLCLWESLDQLHRLLLLALYQRGGLFPIGDLVDLSQMILMAFLKKMGSLSPPPLSIFISLCKCSNYATEASWQQN
ncbi:hypothetical protein HYC85_014249, partial [Camellia sinensis]